MIASLQFSSETICSYRKPILFMLLFLIGLSRDLLTLSLQTIFYQWVRRDSILYRFLLFNKSRRDPMFEFELDESLFKLAVKRPHFEPLFQLPPCLKTRFYCSPYEVLSVLYRPTYAGEKIPPHPLRRGYKAGATQRASTRRTSHSPKKPQRDHTSSQRPNNRRARRRANQ